jgi:hypothetical protein
MNVVIAHVTPHEWPAGLLMFVAGIAIGLTVAAYVWRIRSR